MTNLFLSPFPSCRKMFRVFYLGYKSLRQRIWARCLIPRGGKVIRITRSRRDEGECRFQGIRQKGLRLNPRETKRRKAKRAKETYFLLQTLWVCEARKRSLSRGDHICERLAMTRSYPYFFPRPPLQCVREIQRLEQVAEPFLWLLWTRFYLLDKRLLPLGRLKIHVRDIARANLCVSRFSTSRSDGRSWRRPRRCCRLYSG